MPTTPIRYALLLLLALLPVHPAIAAKFEIIDVSGEKWCLRTIQPLLADSFTPPLCSKYLPGTSRVIVTPDPGELPVKCYDNGNNGNFCMYSANLYIAARYQGRWLVKSGYGWTPVELSQIPSTTAWPLWSGTGSMAYDIFAGEIDLNTSKAVPPPEGFEVWVGINPAGSTSFTPAMVARVYPLPNQDGSR